MDVNGTIGNHMYSKYCKSWLFQPSMFDYWRVFRFFRRSRPFQIWSTKEEIGTTINADMGGTKMRAMGEIAPVTSASLSYGSQVDMDLKDPERSHKCQEKLLEIAAILGLPVCFYLFHRERGMLALFISFIPSDPAAGAAGRCWWLLDQHWWVVKQLGWTRGLATDRMCWSFTEFQGLERLMYHEMHAISIHPYFLPERLVRVCLKIVYPQTQWFMIIIPIKWLFHWEY